MRYIILGFLLLSILFLSGCRFSFWEGGFYNKDKNSYSKIGLFSFDLLFDNANNKNKWQQEEDIKDEGTIAGIYITEEF